MMKSRYMLASLMVIVVAYGTAFAQENTPNDVFAKTQIILKHIESLNKHFNAPQQLPEVPEQHKRKPYHVLQKSYEVLEKIGKLRDNNGLGKITIPPYPSREITPNEVFSVSDRIIDELNVVLFALAIEHPKRFEIAPVAGKTPNDVYMEIWRASLALDALLGVRGFTPNEVFQQTERLLAEVKFLRKSQGIELDVPKPEKPTGKHPNHALAASYDFLKKVRTAQINLWMRPAEVKEVPLRVIIPNEVYDALQEVLAEIQRIKFRLGLEYISPQFEEVHDKTPDDVIQNLHWASALLPTFRKLHVIQRGKNATKKTSNHVYALTQLIIDEIEGLRREKRISISSRRVVELPRRQPKHVFMKAIECLDKVNRYRIASRLGPITNIRHPMRRITPDEVFDAALRLYQEVRLLTNKSAELPSLHPIFDKTPSEVFREMWYASRLLDGLIGERGGYKPSDVFALVEQIIVEFDILRDHIGVSGSIRKPKYVAGKQPSDAIAKAEEVLALLNTIQKRAGIVAAQAPELPKIEVRPEDVYNLVGIIFAEHVSLKIELGIKKQSIPVGIVEEKTPSDVYQNLEYARRQLESVIRQYD